MSSKKIQEISWIRGIAALLIMLYHYTVQYEKSYGHLAKWNIKLPWACGAVNTFFILTAFLTLYTFNNNLSPLKFLYKRAKRLYPAYWICICITSVSMFLFMPENFRGLKTILINLTMFQGFLGVKNVDGVYWTLSYELLFYFYAAIALVIGKRKEKTARNLVLVWILLAYCCFFIEFAGIKNQITAVIRIAMMPQFAAPFSAGALLGFTAKYKKHDILTYLGILLTVPLSFLFQEQAYAIMHVITVIILMIMVQARFVYSRPQYAAAVDKMSRFFIPLNFVAYISYPLYLLHQYIGFAVIKNLELIGLKSEIFILVPIALSIVLAWGVQKIVDALTIAIKRKLNKRPQDAQ